jgi:hypothetical protein
MNLWLEAFLAVSCAMGGVVLGLWFSRRRSPYWTIVKFICPAVFSVKLCP